MRKFLRQKFWSHGTPLGSLGPLSFEDLGPGFDQCQIPLIWGPYEFPVLVACHVQAKKLKSVASWCAQCSFPIFIVVDFFQAIHLLSDINVNEVQKT